jgi:hypothetical protein
MTTKLLESAKKRIRLIKFCFSDTPMSSRVGSLCRCRVRENTLSSLPPLRTRPPISGEYLGYL